MSWQNARAKPGALEQSSALICSTHICPIPLSLLNEAVEHHSYSHQVVLLEHSSA